MAKNPFIGSANQFVKVVQARHRGEPDSLQDDLKAVTLTCGRDTSYYGPGRHPQFHVQKSPLDDTQLSIAIPYLKNFTKIEYLNISNSQVTNNGLAQLADALSPIGVKTLILANNPHVTQVGRNIIKKSLSKVPHEIFVSWGVTSDKGNNSEEQKKQSAYISEFTGSFGMDEINSKILLTRIKDHTGSMPTPHSKAVITQKYTEWFKGRFDMNEINTQILSDRCKEIFGNINDHASHNSTGTATFKDKGNKTYDLTLEPDGNNCKISIISGVNAGDSNAVCPAPVKDQIIACIDGGAKAGFAGAVGCGSTNIAYPVCVASAALVGCGGSIFGAALNPCIDNAYSSIFGDSNNSGSGGFDANASQLSGTSVSTDISGNPGDFDLGSL